MAMAGCGLVVQNWRAGSLSVCLSVWCPLCTQLGLIPQKDSAVPQPQGVQPWHWGTISQCLWRLHPTPCQRCLLASHITHSISAAPLDPFCYSLANLNHGNQLLTWNMVISLFCRVPGAAKPESAPSLLNHILYGSFFLSFSSVVCKASCCSSIKWQNHSTFNCLRKHNFSRMFQDRCVTGIFIPESFRNYENLKGSAGFAFSPKRWTHSFPYLDISKPNCHDHAA